MRRWIAAIGFLLLPGNALALSCMPPTPESVFNLHSDSPERYLMAFGTLTPAGPLPEFNPQTLQHEPSNRFDATFEGHLAGTGGFDRRVTLPVTVRMKCFDDICGLLPVRAPAALFIEVSGGSHLVNTDYCSSTMLADPSELELASPIECMKQDRCTKPDQTGSSQQ